jgi:urease accessory protein
MGPGHAALTEVVVSPGSRNAHPTLSLRSGVLAPRLLTTSSGVARVALVSTTAMLLGGDTMDLRIHVGAGQRLELEDVAATVAYNGRGRSAQWGVTIRVEEAGTLVWHGEPLVVADGAQVARRLRVDVAAGGRALIRDVVVLGRHGERGGSLRCSTAVWHDGAPLLVEDLDLACGPGGLREEPGVIGPHRVAETIICVADPVPATSVTGDGTTVVLDLDGPGVVARRLGASTHASPLDTTWAALSTACA